MKPLSEEAHQIINQLYQKRALFFHSNHDKVELIQELQHEGNVRVIPFLLPFVFDRKDTIAQVTKRTIHYILAQSACKQWIELEQLIKEMNFYHKWSQTWDHLLPSHLSTFEIDNPADATILGLCSFHRNGYVREEAVKILSAQPQGQAIPFLLLRLNDYISATQKRALHGLRNNLRTELSPYFVDAIYLVDHLRNYPKVTDKMIIEEIELLLQSPACQTAVHNGTYHEDRFTRRFCFHFFLQHHQYDDEFLKRALQNTDALIALGAGEAILNHYDQAFVSTWIKLLSMHRYMPLRRRTLHTIMERFADQAKAYLEHALLDRHASIREYARFYLRSIFDRQDFHTFYTSYLLQQPYEETSASAILGLGETGTTSCIPLIEPFLLHPKVKVRKAAVRSIGRLHSSNQTVFIQALLDSSPSVSKEGAKNLIRFANEKLSHQLWNLFIDTSSVMHKKQFLLLFQHSSKRDCLYYTIKARQSSELLIQELSEEIIIWWLSHYNRTFFLTFSEEEKMRLREEIKKMPALTDEMRQMELTQLGH